VETNSPGDEFWLNWLASPQPSDTKAKNKGKTTIGKVALGFFTVFLTPHNHQHF
jgi:hypothetical protein